MSWFARTSAGAAAASWATMSFSRGESGAGSAAVPGSAANTAASANTSGRIGEPPVGGSERINHRGWFAAPPAASWLQYDAGMDTRHLIEQLTAPAAYPHPVGAIEVRQTHISAVFLAGPVVYKVKKPVALGFLDFSTLDQRRHFCDEEVRLHRRLAPHVYL